MIYKSKFTCTCMYVCSTCMCGPSFCSTYMCTCRLVVHVEKHFETFTTFFPGRECAESETGQDGKEGHNFFFPGGLVKLMEFYMRRYGMFTHGKSV